MGDIISSTTREDSALDTATTITEWIAGAEEAAEGCLRVQEEVDTEIAVRIVSCVEGGTCLVEEHVQKA